MYRARRFYSSVFCRERPCLCSGGRAQGVRFNSGHSSYSAAGVSSCLEGRTDEREASAKLSDGGKRSADLGPVVAAQLLEANKQRSHLRSRQPMQIPAPFRLPIPVERVTVYQVRGTKTEAPGRRRRQQLHAGGRGGCSSSGQDAKMWRRSENSAAPDLHDSSHHSK